MPHKIVDSIGTTDDWLKQFGQTPRWGPTPGERSGQAGQPSMPQATESMTDWQMIQDLSRRVKELEKEVAHINKNLDLMASNMDRVIEILKSK